MQNLANLLGLSNRPQSSGINKRSYSDVGARSCEV